MKHIIISIISAFALAACASGPSAYGPAKNYDSVGFKNTQIENDRFRVSYTANNMNEAQDFALLRAAQITLDEGFSHFQIIGGNMTGNGQGTGLGSGVSTSVGVGFGGGRGYRGGGTSVGLGIGLNDVGRALKGDRVTNSIEIRLLNSAGQNQGQNSRDIYDAKSVASSIRPQVFTN